MRVKTNDYFEVYRDSRDRRERQDLNWDVGPDAAEFKEIIDRVTKDVEREMETEVEYLHEEYEEDLREAHEEIRRLKSGVELRETKDALKTALDEMQYLQKQVASQNDTIARLSERNKHTEVQLETERAEHLATKIFTDQLRAKHDHELAALRVPTDELRQQLEEARADLEYWNTQHKCK